MPHDHPSHHHHADDGHAHGGHRHAHPSSGHNRGPNGYAAWELPRASEPSSSPVMAAEPDFDLVEKSFIDGARDHPDSTSFLRLANIPFRAKLPDGRLGYLLGFVIEEVVEVGTVMPAFGGEPSSYNVIPASRLAKRRHLYFQYWTSKGECRFSLAQARALAQEIR